MEMIFTSTNSSQSSLEISNPLTLTSPSPTTTNNSCPFSSATPNTCPVTHPLDQWYTLTTVSAYRPPPSSIAHPQPTNGIVQLYSVRDNKVVYLVHDWIQAWNSSFYLHEGRILSTCPLLFLYSFICFHSLVWKVVSIISIYVFIVLTIFLITNGLSPDMVVLVSVSGFLCLIIAPVSLKGSYSAESTRSIPKKCSNSGYRRFDTSNISRNLSLLNSIYSLFSLTSTSSTSSLNVSPQDEHDLEASKLLDLQDPISIPGLYYYLEAMTGYLQHSSCISFSYRPPSEVTMLLKISLYTSISFSVFLWAYRSATYFMFCGYGFNLYNPDASAYCKATSWQFIILLGSSLTCITLTTLSLMYFTLLALLLYTAHLLNTLMRFWIQRYKVLRLVKKSDYEEEYREDCLAEENQHEGFTEMANDDDSGGGNGYGSGHGDGKKKRSEEEWSSESQQITLQRRRIIFHSLERDAHERYLLIHYFAQEISLRWGPFIACSLVFNALCCVGGYFYLLVLYTNFHYIDFFALIVIVYNVFALLFITITIAYANTNVDQLKSHFIQSTEDDYSLIGGRAAWLEYIDQTPVHWTVFGFAITPAWIVSILVTIVTGVFGVIGAPVLFG